MTVLKILHLFASCFFSEVLERLNKFIRVRGFTSIKTVIILDDATDNISTVLLTVRHEAFRLQQTKGRNQIGMRLIINRQHFNFAKIYYKTYPMIEFWSELRIRAITNKHSSQIFWDLALNKLNIFFFAFIVHRTIISR
jgi:hypothetical protein